MLWWPILLKLILQSHEVWYNLGSYQYQGFKKLVSKTAKFVSHFTVYLSLPPTAGQLAERRPLDFSNYYKTYSFSYLK